MKRFSWGVQSVAVLVLVAFLAMVTGCGSQVDRSPLATGGGSGPTTGFFLGRVLLEDFVSGAQVTISDLNGTQLYLLKTDNMGLFHGEGGLPADFRITASRPGDPMVVRREIRGGYDGLTMYVNPLTTLSALYMENHSVDLSTAEQAVAKKFSIPRGFNFDWITNARVSPFSPARFYQLATQNGGNRAFYQKLAGEIDSLPHLLVLADDEEGGKAKLAKDLGKTILGDLLGDTISVIDAGIFGAVTQALGFNLGTSGALNAISQQLDQVLAGIKQIEQTLSLNNVVGTYNADRNTINPDLNNIKNTNQTIVNTVQGLNTVSSLTSTSEESIWTI